jgi:4-hydroxy-2-oxoheptanedioate aldolase
VRKRWAGNRVASNLWIDVGWPVTVEALSRLNYDSYTIDLQHSLIDRGTLTPLLQALSTGTGAPMVRISQNDPAEIAFVLDAGAYGVICPTVETSAQCRDFVAACLYPPNGVRSWGPVRGLLYGGADYFQSSSDEVLKVALIETVRGIENLDDIAATPGLDMIYLGPNDLGISYGATPSYTPNHPSVTRAIDLVGQAARKHSIAAGMHTASSEVARLAIDRGFTFLSLGYAAKIMLAAAARLHEEVFGTNKPDPV